MAVKKSVTESAFSFRHWQSVFSKALGFACHESVTGPVLASGCDRFCFQKNILPNMYFHAENVILKRLQSSKAVKFKT